MGILPILIYVALAILFGLLVMVLTFFLGPKKPTPEKLAPYESGLQEIEAPKRRPLAILLKNELKVLGLIELLVFLLILMIGYIYVWRKGAFTWE